MIKGRLAIFGAGGHGKVVAEAALASGWQDITFYDDKFPHENHIGSYVVSGNFKNLISDAGCYDGCHVAIGSNNIRLDFIKRLKSVDIRLPNIIHPSAIISSTVLLADAACILPGVIVNAGSKIGVGVILNSASSIDHDCKVEDAVHISPGAHLGGGVTVGPKSWIGIGATVINAIQIGADAIVGAGSVVIRDVPSGVTSVGVPSRVIRESLHE